MRNVLGLVIVLICALTAPVQAVQILEVTGQLTGDIRGENPDNIIVDVSITVDDSNPSLASWTFDINSPLHPDIKLDEFYFNLALADAADVLFSNFDPTGWEIETPADVQGAGFPANVTFLFEALDPSGPPNADDVTNDRNLTFDMTLLTGAIEAELFTSAMDIASNDAGHGQMGAHLQSLVEGPGNNTDSGFAFGNYVYDDTTIQTVVPEPGTVLLLGGGLLGLGVYGLRRKRS